MLDKLIELISRFFELLTFITIVDEYEAAVVLTLGRYRGRVLAPGPHWIWPFAVDKVLSDSTYPRPYNMEASVLTTADEVIVQAGMMVRWRVHDISRFALRVEDPEDVIQDIAYGELSSSVRKSTVSTINTQEWVRGVYEAARSRGWWYGIEVLEIQMTDLSRTRVLRLINSS